MAFSNKKLRKQAEARIEDMMAEADLSDPQDIKKLLHEIKVHQIELEIQNEELRKAQVELQLAKDRYYDLYQRDPVGHITLDSQGMVKELNAAFTELIEMDPYKIIGRHFFRCVAEEDQSRYLLWFQHILKSKTNQYVEIQLQPTSGIQKRVQLFAKRVRLPALDGQQSEAAEEVLITAFDITKQHENQRKIEELHLRLDTAIQVGNLAWWHMELPSGNVSFHRRKTDILGYDYDDFEGKHYRLFMELLHPEDEPRATQAMRDHLEGKSDHYNVEYRIKAADGDYRWFRDFGAASERSPEGEPLGVVGIATDITEKKVKEQQIQSSLREKETLLREIHHRVKNNLSVVSSLLKLHCNTLKNADARQAIKESQGRIHAMSSVHEVLYNSENLYEIDLKKYLNKISGTLIQTYLFNPGRIKLKIECDDLKLNIEKASPLGLTINELISNSLKYAFPNGQAGEINLRAAKRGEQLELIIQDDGIGMSKGFDWKDGNTLGLKLVFNLIENQLDGSIDLLPGKGTVFSIKIPLKNSHEQSQSTYRRG